MQQDLGPGEYWFHVVDDIGCMDTSINILVEEPHPIFTTSAILTEAKCAEPQVPGSIEVSMDGGTPGITKEYTYMWRWWYNPTPTEDSSFHYAGEGRHYLTVLDSNQCQFDTSYYIDYVNPIIVDTDTSNYFGYAISCNGLSDGWIEIEVREGFAPYDVKVYPYLGLGYGEAEYAASTPVAEILGLPAEQDTIVRGLPEDEYVVFAYDQENCFNGSPWEYREKLSDPDSISIWRENEPVNGMLDISCFNNDDGEIELGYSGGRTGMYSSIFTWTGYDPHLDLVNNVSMQDSLGPGTYSVIVADTAAVQIQQILNYSSRRKSS